MADFTITWLELGFALALGIWGPVYIAAALWIGGKILGGWFD